MADDRRLHHLLADVVSNDPHRALVACRQLADVELAALELRAVRLARAHGWGWARIGRLLGTRQSMWERFRRHDVEPPEHPMPGPSLAYRLLRREAILAVEAERLEELRRAEARRRPRRQLIRRAPGRAS